MGKAPALGIVVALGLQVGPALAQGDEAPRAARAPGDPNRRAPNVLNLQRTQLGTSGIAKTARARMLAGDCAGALDLFDDALRTSLDPTLYRDRGMCHERMGHPYPAIDDYRKYLTAAPKASDASEVRDRLERLQDDVRGGAGRRVSVDDDIPPAAPAIAAGPASRPHSAPVEGKRAREDERSAESRRESGHEEPTSETDADARPDGTGKDAVTAARDRQNEDADEEEEDFPEALRSGRGWALAPVLGMRAWLRGDSLSNGASWSQAIGAALRYSTGPRLAVLFEVGYQRFDATTLSVETISGMTSLVELELRFASNARYDDQLLLAPGVGFEYLAFEPGGSSVSSSYTEGAPTARIRVGYRHMLARAVAFDVTLDGGVAQFLKLHNGSFDAHAATGGIAGLNAGFFWSL